MIKDLIKGLEPADAIDAMNKLYDHRSHIIDLQSPDSKKVFELYT